MVSSREQTFRRGSARKLDFWNSTHLARRLQCDTASGRQVRSCTSTVRRAAMCIPFVRWISTPVLARQRVANTERDAYPGDNNEGKDRSTEKRATEITVCDRRRTESIDADAESRVTTRKLRRRGARGSGTYDCGATPTDRRQRGAHAHSARNYRALAPIGSGMIPIRETPQGRWWTRTDCDQRQAHSGTHRCASLLIRETKEREHSVAQPCRRVVVANVRVRA